MQKTYDYQNTYIVTLFIISIYSDLDELIKHMISSPYYGEILCFVQSNECKLIKIT